MVFCSGSSVCKTHCWPSEVLWLFRQSPVASGPVEEVFCHPSRPGIGSGSWMGQWEKKRVICALERTIVLDYKIKVKLVLVTRKYLFPYHLHTFTALVLRVYIDVFWIEITHLPPHYCYLFVKLSSVKTRVFLQHTMHNSDLKKCYLLTFLFLHSPHSLCCLMS